MDRRSTPMVFQQLNPGPCRTYFIGSLASKDAALVDPIAERVADYLELLSAGGWQLRYAIDTHTHADHISGAGALAERTGAAVAMHRSAPARCVSERLSDGSTLRLGEVTLEFVDTPGHTRDSVTIRLPGRVLTGDWLFIGGAGRTDLPGGDPGEHWESLQRVIPTLPEDTLVFPAHDYQNQDHAVLGDERRSNPNLRPLSREEYVEWLTSMAQETPSWMLQVLEANQVCTSDPRAVAIPQEDAVCMAACRPAARPAGALSIPAISAEQLQSMLQRPDAPFLLDVRQPEEYVGPLGHVPGALLIPLPQLRQRLGEIGERRGQTVVTICRSGARSLTAAAILKEAGFESVLNLTGGTEAWYRLGFPVER